MPIIAQQDYIVIDVQYINDVTEAETKEIAKYFYRTAKGEDLVFYGDMTIFSVVIRELQSDNLYRILTVDWSNGYIHLVGRGGIISIEIPSPE